MGKTARNMSPERLLALVLRLTGAVTMLAVFAVFLPRPWMERIHEAAGLGRMPDGIVVDYLARSLSLFYAMYGGILWLVAGDVRRYERLIAYFAIFSIAGPIVIAANTLRLGFPLWWTAGEFAFPFAFGTAVLILQAAMRREIAGR
ncbi:MAG: hypothetical protein N3A38_00600 [Planctomycetota bacterium]|nr:hypothetical protein [Planctomycetota bacterium]